MLQLIPGTEVDYWDCIDWTATTYWHAQFVRRFDGLLVQCHWTQRPPCWDAITFHDEHGDSPPLRERTTGRRDWELVLLQGSVAPQEWSNP